MASKAVTESKIALGINPNVLFYSNLISNLRLEETTDTPTADVDGINLRINPDWFSKLPILERVFLLAHEASHVVYEHHETLKRFANHKQANYAADYYINAELRQTGLPMPSGGLYNENFRGMSIDQIYQALEGTMDEDDYDPSLLDVVPNKGDDPQKTYEVVQAIKNAVEATKGAGGRVPESVEKLVFDYLNPMMDWETKLINFAYEQAERIMTWEKPDYNYFPDYILPDLGGRKTGSIAFAVDSSGSVSDEEYILFLSAIHECREIIHPELTRIVDFTTQVNNEHLLKEGETLDDVHFRSYGGTDLHPVFEHLAEDPPHFLVVFSDLDCAPVEEDPGYPVIWICINNPYAKVNFGELYHYKT